MQRLLTTAKSIVFVILVSAMQAGHADVRAMLDRNTIYEGDTVTLTIEADGNDRDSSPDISVLEKDFSILGTGNSRQVQIINGHRSDKQQWRIELEPKHDGDITIPAIEVGKASTRPLTLTIQAPPTADTGSDGQALFLQMQVSEPESTTFVQQQVRLTARLFYRIPLVEGSFSDPQPKDAIVERLGDDRQYQTTVNQQAYQVIERRYAIFPEKSGSLTIPAINFSGRMISESGQRQPGRQMDSMLDRFFGGNSPFNDPFFTRNPFGDPGKRIRIRSNPLSLTISARPANYQGSYWLPSEQLVLQDSWAEAPPEFRVGEPVTRTIRLHAKGLESSHLPDLELKELDGMRQYPEQAVAENHTDGEWVFGTRTQSIAYVPSRPGPIKLPEIQLGWWDTVNGKQQTATIPAWEVNVLPAAGTADVDVAAPTASLPKDGAEIAAETMQSGLSEVAAESGTQIDQPAWRPVYWYWLTAAAGVIAVIAIAIRRLRSRRHSTGTFANQPAATSRKSQQSRNQAARRALQQACKENNPRTAEQALLSWAAGTWPEDPPRSLGVLLQRINQGAAQVRELDQALYAPDPQHWQGEKLWNVFRNGLAAETGKPQRTGDVLAPLYPAQQRKQA